ncbi:MAG: helix-turn-helix domain-containing protein [Candidatus Aenigmatarchaeota archaeon]
MDWKKIAKKLEGLQTVESISRELDIKRRTAINYLSKLRQEGYIHRQSRGKGRKRLYRIKPRKKRETGKPGLYETINENSPIEVVVPYETRVHGREITSEEAIARAVEKGEFRLILASLALFRKVEDWFDLYNEAKKKGVGRKVGALYDLSRKTVSKISRMDGRVRNLLKKTDVDDKYIVSGLKTDDFKSIENEWNVWVPFNKEDLKRYKQ